MGETRTTFIRRPIKDKQRLDELAAFAARSGSRLAAEAVCFSLDLQHRLIFEIASGLAEADRGEFASEEEVSAVVSDWAPAQATHNRSWSARG